MQSVLDSYLGIHPQALALEAQRTEVLAANMANADTPNYKARDLDFKAALAAASGADSSTVSLATTHPNDLTSAGTPAGSAAPDASSATLDVSSATSADAATAGTSGTYVKYRVPLAPALDGNTVDEQLEESAFATNSVRYQASLTFLNGKLRDLMTAISSS